MVIRNAIKAFVYVAVVGMALGSLGLFYIFLSSREPSIYVSEHSPVIGAVTKPGVKGPSLRFAVATMWSLESTFSQYRQLSERIAGDLGLKNSLILRPSYKALRRAMENGEVDVAFVCTGPYVYTLPGKHMRLLAKPEFINGTTYRSVILALSGSGIRSVQDLHGTIIGFSDSESFSGYILPYVMLKERGLDPDAYFKKVVFTGSHDRSIIAVDRGIVQAAAVHSIVWETAKRDNPALREKLKEIWYSDTYGPPPVIVSAGMSGSFSDSLKKAFLNFHKDREGRAILSAVGIERFIPAREEDYFSAIRLFQRFEKVRGKP
ncbi:MAG: phosphate/phosphite/phosphonate ABC transporter substrate-binding protein [Candidatus Latescibacterota bacterium]